MEKRRKREKKEGGGGSVRTMYVLYIPPANAREEDRWDPWYLVCFKINFI